MKNSFNALLNGYEKFREKYASGDRSVMQFLSKYGQKPKVMVVACCDSRVDPALILQCDPGDLFVVRNVANIVPPYEKDAVHHGTSAALEFAICFLEVQHLILLGHSQCGGIEALLNHAELQQNDFITNWVSIIKAPECNVAHPHSHLYSDLDIENYAKLAMDQSFENCMGFPWINERVKQKTLIIHLWFFDIKSGQIFMYSKKDKMYVPLSSYQLTDLDL